MLSFLANKEESNRLKKLGLAKLRMSFLQFDGRLKVGNLFSVTVPDGSGLVVKIAEILLDGEDKFGSETALVTVVLAPPDTKT